MGSCVCHMSTTIPPMDLKPLAFAPSGADAHHAHHAHDAVPTVACKHYLDHSNPTQVTHLSYVGCIVPLVQPYGILCLPYVYNYTTYGPQTTCIRSLWCRCTPCTPCTRCSTDGGL